MKKNLIISIVVFSLFILILGSSVLAETTIRITSDSGAVALNIKTVAELFEQKYPDIRVNTDVVGAVEYYKANFPQIADSSSAPDVAFYWVDGRQYQDIVKAGLLIPLNDLYKQEGWYDCLPKSTVEKYTSPDGNLYAVNIEISWFPMLFYNEVIFKELGINPPDTYYRGYSSLEEWYGVVDKIKAAGYQAVTCGAGEGFVVGHIHDAILQRMIPQNLMDDLYNNWRLGWDQKIKYTDKIWIDAEKMLLEWKEHGVFADGFLGRNYEEGRMLFDQSKAAMYMDGSWIISILRNEAPNINIGWMHFPKIVKDIDPKFILWAGNALMIPKNSQHIEEAKKFVAFYLSKEAQIATLEHGSVIPARMDIEPSEIQKIADPLLYDMWCKLDEVGTTTAWDDPIPAELAEKSFSLVQAMLAGSITPETVGEELQHTLEGIKARQQLRKQKTIDREEMVY